MGPETEVGGGFARIVCKGKQLNVGLLFYNNLLFEAPNALRTRGSIKLVDRMERMVGLECDRVRV